MVFNPDPCPVCVTECAAQGGDDDYEFNANDYPDPYPQEVVQRALMERNLVDATKVLEDTNIKEAQAVTHVDATKVLEEEDTNIKL